MKKELTALVGLLALAVLLFGCGGGEASSPAPLTKAVFVKKASALCERSRQKAAENTASSFSSAIHQTVLPAIEEAVEGIRSLGMPSGDESKIEAMLDSTQEAVEQAEGQKVSSLPELETFFKKAASEARKYGIPACAYSR